MEKLVDQYNKKKLINADYSAFTEKCEANHKAPKFIVNDRVLELLNIAIFLVNITLKIGQEVNLLLILFRKLILWHIKLKI